jgi:hypothetical protein
VTYWRIPVIPAPRRLRQEDSRPDWAYLKKISKNKQNKLPQEHRKCSKISKK